MNNNISWRFRNRAIVLFFGILISLQVLGQNLVGNVNGQFNVSSSGAATYSIPIDCPEGIKGFKPSISLTYNSQGGNGIAGLGWNIGGLSMITRVPKNMYYNNGVASVNWEDDEEYSLDGNRIISNFGDFVFENDDNSTIEEHMCDDDNNVYFKVFKKNGEVWQYGSTSGNNIWNGNSDLYTHNFLTTSGNKCFSWQLSSITDPNGNAISFTYTEDISPLTDENTPISGGYDYRLVSPASNYIINNRISSIDYSYNNGVNMSAYCSILFNYETRPDTCRSYILSSLYLQQKRLTSITVNSIDRSQPYRKYQLSYLPVSDNPLGTYAGHSKLNQVTISGANNSQLNPIVINWTKETDGSTDIVKSVQYTNTNSNIKDPVSDATDLNYIPFDYNKDGLTDIITQRTSSGTVTLNKAFIDASSGKISYVADGSYYTAWSSFSILPGNFSNQAQTTLMTMTPNPFNGGSGSGYFFKDIKDMNQTSSYASQLSSCYYYLSLKSPIGSDYSMPDLAKRPVLYTVSDINNDGYDDIIVLERAVKN